MQNSTIFTIFLIAMSLDCNIKIEIKTNIDIKTNMYDFPIEKKISYFMSSCYYYYSPGTRNNSVSNLKKKISNGLRIEKQKHKF